MLQRTLLVLNRAKVVVPSKCARINKFGLKTSVNYRGLREAGTEKILTGDVVKIGKCDKRNLCNGVLNAH